MLSCSWLGSTSFFLLVQLSGSARRLWPKNHVPPFRHILQRQALKDTAKRGVIKHGFARCNAYEFPQRQGVASAPADAALRIDAFGITGRKHAEITARQVDLRPGASNPSRRRSLLQALVKRHAPASEAVVIRKPQVALLFLAPAKTHTASSTNFDSLSTIIPA